jgi:Zn-dependent protease
MSARPHFRVLGIPVRVEPVFWIIAVLFGVQYERFDLIFAWVLVVFVSILVHELGHGVALRLMGQPASIVLHAWGGVTLSPRRLSTKTRSIIVSLAGSVTAFVLLGLPARALDGSAWWFEQELFIRGLVTFTAFVNVWWSLANLLPIRPLDGGNVATELFGVSPARWISIVTGGVAAVYAFANDYEFAAFFAAGLAVFNFIEERNAQRGGGVPVFDVEAPDTDQRGGAGRRRRTSARNPRLQSVPPLAPAQPPSGPDREQAENRAWAALRDGRPEAAIAVLEPFSRDNKLDPFLRAALALGSGRGPLADELFERAYAVNPSGPPNLVVATMLADQGRAVSVAHRLVAKGTPGTDAAGSLQTHLHYAERYREAAEVGELVFAGGPSSPAQTAFEVACSWARAGAGDEAVRWVETAIDSGFTAGRLLDGEPDLDSARRSAAWPLVRARLDGQ